mgnify:CR=1 FL=1
MDLPDTPMDSAAPVSSRITWQTEVHIAWICVLPVEYTAALNIHDKSYNKNEVRIVNGVGDENIYHAGKIGDHDVVINCPTGTAGLYTAQNVATNMKSTFPAIHFALLVGIGGGAPHCKNDVRLGDVVVSNKVIPYR